MNNNKNDANCQSTVYFVVYVIWCNKTNMYYVGITCRCKAERRIQEHIKGKQFIDKEIQKIGWEGNWDWWIVEEHIPAENIAYTPKVTTGRMAELVALQYLKKHAKNLANHAKAYRPLTKEKVLHLRHAPKFLQV